MGYTLDGGKKKKIENIDTTNIINPIHTNSGIQSKSILFNAKYLTKESMYLDHSLTPFPPHGHKHSHTNKVKLLDWNSNPPCFCTLLLPHSAQRKDPSYRMAKGVVI